MKDIESICKIAVVQAEPVMFYKSASLEKALRCIGEAAQRIIQTSSFFPSSLSSGIPLG